MPSFQKVLFTAALTMLAFFALHQSADAHEATITLPSAGSWVDTSQTVDISATVTIDEPGRLKLTPKLNSGGLDPIFDHESIVGEPAFFSYSFTPGQLELNCIDGSIQIGMTVVFFPEGEDGGPSIADHHQSYACGSGPQPTLIAADPSYFQVTNEICGNQNDEVTYSQANVTVLDRWWVGNTLTFTLQAGPGFIFDSGPTTNIHYIDAGNCVVQGVFPMPIQIDQCGPANDTFENGGELPAGVNPDFTVSASGDTLTVTYSALSGYVFQGGSFTVSFNFTDENTLCDIVITEPLTPPTIVERCGALNDTVTPASSQPEGVLVEPDISQYSQAGVITLTYAAAEGYVFADGYNNVITHTDQGDNCPILTIDIDDTTLQNLPTEGNLIMTGSLVLDGVDLNDATNQQLFLNGNEATFWSRLRDGSTWRYEWRSANSDLRAMCIDGQIQVSASVDVMMYGVTETYSVDPYSVPCSLGADAIVVIPTGEVTQIEICGTTDQQINDIITLVPQEGVAIESQTWGNGEYLIYLEPAQGYVFPPNTETLVRTRDQATQCEPSTLTLDENSQVLMDVQVGQEVTLTAMLGLPEGNPYDAANLTLRMAGTGEELNVSLIPTLGTGGVLPVEFTYVIPANFGDACSNYSNTMPLELTAYLTGPSYWEPIGVIDSLATSGALPCSLAEAVTPDVDLIVQAEICGDANDTFSTSQEGVELTVGEWVDNEATITFTALEGYYIPEGTTATFQVTDAGTDCLEPSVSVVPDVDDPFVDIRYGETVVPVTVTVNFPSENGSPGVVMTYGVELDGVTVGYSSQYLPPDHTWPTDFAHDLWLDETGLLDVCDDGVASLYVYAMVGRDSAAVEFDSIPVEYPCNLLLPITPNFDLISHNAVCGDANDTFSTSQEGVELAVGEWVDNEATITFTALEGYYIPEGADVSMTVTDEGDCVVTPELPSIEQVVCGPNNDIITIPDQPEGVIINDSGWENNQRNISWIPDDGYIFQDDVPGGMIASDRDTPCDEETVTVQLTVFLNTSDGGSIEGTPYEVHAPQASMAQQAPFAVGVVDADNQIVLEELLPGEYRLVGEPEGYEPIDTVLTVTEGEESQEIAIEVAAVQVPATPSPTVEPTAPATPDPTAPTTPDPTISVTPDPTFPATPLPTTEASPSPSEEAIVEPTATEQSVSGLPETGTGSGGSSLIVGLAGLIAAAMIVTMIGIRGDRSRLR